MKKTTKVMFILICVLSMLMTTGCFGFLKKENSKNPEETLKDAFSYMNECKNFRVIATTNANVSISAGNPIVQKNIVTYEEGNGKQISITASDDYDKMIIYSELVDGNYVTYDNLTSSDTLYQSSFYTYELLRKTTIYLGMDLSADDFNYVPEEDVFVGNTSILSEKLKEYYYRQNPTSAESIQLNASVSQFNIMLEEGKFEEFEVRYTISTVQYGVSSVMNYHVIYQFDNYESTTVETPQGIYK